MYTRFQFNIYQIISVFDAHKLLPNYEARALLYQAFLVSKDPDTQIRLLELLKIEFDNDNLSSAFDEELLRLIQTIDSQGISPCLLYTSPSPRDRTRSRMPSSA